MVELSFPLRAREEIGRIDEIAPKLKRQTKQ